MLLLVPLEIIGLREDGEGSPQMLSKEKLGGFGEAVCELRDWPGKSTAAGSNF